MKKLCIDILIGAVVLCSVMAQAILIDFEDYVLNQDVVGQPSSGTKWSGGLNCFYVTNNVGVNGGKCIEMQPTASRWSTTSYIPTDEDWGGTFDTNKVYEFSYDLQLGETADSSSFLDVWLGRTTSSYCVTRFAVSGDGTFGAWEDVLSDGEWHTISGEFQYSTYKYNLYIDGELKYEDHDFYRTPISTFGYFGLNVKVSTASNYVFRVDNIYLQEKPIPPSGSVFILK